MLHRWATVRRRRFKICGRWPERERGPQYCVHCGAELFIKYGNWYGRMPPYPKRLVRLWSMPRPEVITRMPPCEGLPVGYEAPVGV